MRSRSAWMVMVVVAGVLGLWWWRERGGSVRMNDLAEGRASRDAGHRRAVAAASAVTNSPTADEAHPYRLRNTARKDSELLRDDTVLLLANAVVDTTQPFDYLVPEKLRAGADNGTWLVQARAPLDQAFQAVLDGAGAQVISFIPNNADLVRATTVQAQQLRLSPLVRSVVPYHPYYKLTDPALLKLAVTGQDLPADVGLRLGLYADTRTSTLATLKQMGVAVGDEERTPFGTVVTAHPAAGTFLDVARLDGVMVVEATHQRTAANDLTRPRLGESADSVTNVDYLSLSGLNIRVGVVDSGVDAGHPDLTNRVIGDVPASLTDTNGHGTFVVDQIIGSGLESATVTTNASGSVSNANFRGAATNATALVIAIPMDTRPQQSGGAPASDVYVQETLARSNVFIANHSWTYDGDTSYDLAAALFDWAARDALPGVTGPQPLLQVFAAGNNGQAGPDGNGGINDTIGSPGTSKNGITVGAVEQNRQITNRVVRGGVTNAVFLPQTDSSNQVAGFASRGNVGVGVEGPAGRSKPDVVAPGTFVIAAKSGTWNQAEYYNPSNLAYSTRFNQTVQGNGLAPYSVVVPPGAVQVVITVLPDEFSPSPFPSLPFYVKVGDVPGTNAGSYDALVTNGVTLPGDLALTPGSEVFYVIGNPTNTPVTFDVQTLVVTTNDNGNQLTVLSNLNAGLGPYYRYESGTSMAAAGVSGLLALVQEFLEQRLQLTNHSPALLKALLINGSRTVSSQYDFNVGGVLNAQGWGLPNLSNSIPGALTNAGTGRSLWFYDQTNLLATGQEQTWTLKRATNAGTQPLRATLVWTDPPGNPAAGPKLVNDLDLMVTNLDTKDVYYGNDIPAGSDFNETRGTNGTPNPDTVNNVENVYLLPPLGTNYTVTVHARRVNVNAVTTNTNNVVQDFALVISYGDGGVSSNALTVTTGTVTGSNNVSGLTVVSNGVPLLNQRAGANSQYVTLTNGVTNQWQFYVFTNSPTNTPNYTNVAFVTFSPPELGLTQIGARQLNQPANAVRVEADVDIYVSQNPDLTNLDTNVVNAAFQSVGRTGTEKVLLTNSSPGQVYYIGVKSEDREGAQYGFVGVALTNSFDQQDTNGNTILTVLTPPLPAAIPPGTPAHPGSVTVLAVTTSPVQARKVVVTDSLTHQEPGDLVGVWTHGQKTAVLNNHSFFTNMNDTTETNVYDDSGESDPEFPGARHTDGPGSLTDFIGDTASDGVWMLTMVNDSSPSDTGTLNSLTAVIVPQTATNGFQAAIPADTWFYDFIDVPAAATNLTVNVGIGGLTPGPVDVYLRRGAIPDPTDYDKFAVVNPPGTNFSLGIFDSPPLNPGRYFIGVFNPNAFAVTVNVNWTLGLALGAVQPLKVVSVGNEPILDDAVTDSTNHVGAVSRVVSAEVGVRIDHPRISDLVLTLISPSGTRVLLAENRGGLSANYGSGVNITNVTAPTTNGSFTGNTNVINVGTNQGTLVIAYNFFTVPDDLRVYYDGNRIFDTGLISGTGTLSVDFGPGMSGSVNIVMNEAGTNPNGTNGDQWTYQVTEITRTIIYATFTEDTSLTTTPIKFATPPFGTGAPPPPVVADSSSFETVPAADYSNTVFEGWTVGSNAAKVVYVTALAANEGNALAGSNVLALHHSVISRSLPTTAGQNYTLTFVNHGRPQAGPVGSVGPVGWWKGDGNTLDSSGFGNSGNFQGGAGSAIGLVSNAFSFSGTSQYVDVSGNPAVLNPTQAITTEAWIFPTISPSGQNVSAIMKKAGPSQATGYAMEYDPSVGGVKFFVYTSSGWKGTFATSPPPLNTWSHLAGVYDGANIFIYLNGVVNSSQPASGPIVSSPFDLQIAHDPDPLDNPPNWPTPRFFDGLIDEATIFSNALSILQIQDIYAAGSAGKLPVGQIGPVRTSLTLAGVTNTILSGIDAWTTNFFTFTFTAPSNGTVLTLSNLDDGMLFDSFQLVQNPGPNPANYYLPEESLSKLVGESSQGDWKLEILDNRAGATNPTPNLISWQLSLVLDRVNPAAIPLLHAIPNTNTVAPGFTAYYLVDVPAWAKFATNTLITASAPVNLLFNQNQLPGTGGTDLTLAGNTTGFTTTFDTIATTPLLLPGQRYYLGVQNNGAVPVTFGIEVDFDITTLTNLMPLTNTLAAATVPRYYQYDVSTNALAVAYELLNPNGNVDLVVSKGPPLPTLTSFAYASGNPGTNNEVIVLSSNSLPVALAPGRWYLGVFNQDVIPVTYTIEAIESGPPTIILLTNDEFFTTNVSAGPVPNLFFEFDISNSPAGTLYELLNLTGDVDLALQRGSLPYAPPYLGFSGNPGTSGEQIVIRTNLLGTNLNGSWFLTVPNNTASNVSFTIHAVVTDTNGLLVSGVPIAPGVTLPGPGGGTGPTLTWATVVGEQYDMQYSSDLVNWTDLPGMPVTATGPFTAVTDPTPIAGQPFRYYRILQVP